MYQYIKYTIILIINNIFINKVISQTLWALHCKLPTTYVCRTKDLLLSAENFSFNYYYYHYFVHIWFCKVKICSFAWKKNHICILLYYYLLVISLYFINTSFNLQCLRDVTFRRMIIQCKHYCSFLSILLINLNNKITQQATSTKILQKLLHNIQHCMYALPESCLTFTNN